MKYVEHLVKSMEYLAEDPRVVFIGQSVAYSGNSIFNTLKTIPNDHLDKMEEMTRGAFQPRVIVRTSIGAKTPLNGGVQHTKDHTKAFKHMLENVEVVLLENKEDIIPAYEKALNRQDSKSTLLVEFGEFYNQ